MMLGAKTFAPMDVVSTSSLALDPSLGRRRHSAWSRCRNLRPRIGQQDHAGAAHHCRGAEAGRQGGLH